ncbi:uncharacterized protein MYCFIDRAFT_83541 [Pseudocercospora fijiensis CIRAD86]|uniref:Uncharacterized protein n=1 Tax=Pseudocercospora fijiensis (strain CIRAD86) TaxID=383855 RepID=M2YWY0_PSEFD|nr:uncharacterized protein MYCFIDRAFT_83541 [Pseudocercospora fijiensis CIRAD86]EME82210.1 hypothetical protein MYCFIDRAFT_83541 [Pseudocercospora fijiensis CIRAD86]
MVRDADWYTSGFVPETPPSSTRPTLSRESSKASSSAENAATSDSKANNSQTIPPPPELCKPTFRMTPRNRQETTNKVIQDAGKAAAEHLRSSFKGASKLNPYLREIAKLENYPERNGFDWDAAKRKARARGWKTGIEGGTSTPWMRKDALRRSYEGLNKIAKEVAPAVESPAGDDVQRAPMPNGKLRRIEKTRVKKAPNSARDNTDTIDLTGDSH